METCISNLTYVLNPTFTSLWYNIYIYTSALHNIHSRSMHPKKITHYFVEWCWWCSYKCCPLAASGWTCGRPALGAGMLVSIYNFWNNMRGLRAKVGNYFGSIKNQNIESCSVAANRNLCKSIPHVVLICWTLQLRIVMLNIRGNMLDLSPTNLQVNLVGCMFGRLHICSACLI